MGDHSTVDTSAVGNPWDPTNPRFFSGTNCSAVAVAPAISGHVTHAQLLVGGTAVKDYYDTAFPGHPAAGPNVALGTNQTSAALTVHFDSTHFADASAVVVKVIVNDSGGNTYDSQITGNTYNKAYVLGNNTLGEGHSLDQYMSQAFIQDKYSTNAQPDTSDAKAAILQNLPTYSAMYFETHGNIGIFGDCYAYANEPYTPTQILFAWTDPIGAFSIPQALNTKALTVPPYNFVYIDACDTSDDASLATAFGVNTTTDTGFLGWTGECEDEQALLYCDQTLMSDLSTGMTLTAAKNDALLQFPVDSLKLGDKSAKLTIWGDGNMTLHTTVYGSTTVTWFK